MISRFGHLLLLLFFLSRGRGFKGPLLASLSSSGSVGESTGTYSAGKMSIPEGAFEVPPWFAAIKASPRATSLGLREWLDEAWRKEGGWQGRDYVHSLTAACRIVEYCLLKPEETSGTSFPTLHGLCVFTPGAESHRGFCHGGALCALMDDCIGWLGFCSSGECLPWSGFTVQIDTSLKKSVPVGSVLAIEGSIESISGRKVWCTAKLVDPLSGSIHCECRGLFLTNKDL